jgi:hypothetical protein
MRFVDTVTPQLREVRPQGYPKRMQSRCGEEIKATQGWPPMSHHVFSSRAAWTADIGTSDEVEFHIKTSGRYWMFVGVER